MMPAPRPGCTERASGLNLARAKRCRRRKAASRSQRSVSGSEPCEIEVKRISDLIPAESEQRDLLIYVHGFNQTFETAALYAARLSDDIRFRGETMVFAWPSKAKLFDHAYDRESAMWSRDALERASLARASPGVGRIHIVAHSVGTMLSMEALRQMYAPHGLAVTKRFGAVIFAAPDIDMDVFSSSLERMRPSSEHHRGHLYQRSRARRRGLDRRRNDPGRRRREGQLEPLGLCVIDASAKGGGSSTTTCSCRTRTSGRRSHAVDAVAPHPSKTSPLGVPQGVRIARPCPDAAQREAQPGSLLISPGLGRRREAVHRGRDRPSSEWGRPRGAL